MILATSVTLVAGLLLPFVVIPALARRGVVDEPTSRSSHARTTVRGGGVAVLGALLIGFALIQCLVSTPAHVGPAALSAACLAIFFLGAVGLVEDVKGLPVAVRLLLQAVGGVAAMLLLAGGMAIPFTVALVAVIALVYTVNATNFMDGINGLSSAHGATVGAYFAFLGTVADDRLLSAAALVVGAAFLSFMPWNFPRARAFLGDVGSYGLGAAGWALLVWAMADGLPVVVVIAPFTVYAVDVLSTLVSRGIRRESLISAHRDHVYQRLSRQRSHGYATLMVTGATLGGVVSSVVVLTLRLPIEWLYAALAAIMLTYFLWPRLTAESRSRSVRSTDEPSTSGQTVLCPGAGAIEASTAATARATRVQEP